jgi:hypothetical protein
MSKIKRQTKNWKEQRRLHAVKLKRAGWKQKDIATALDVSPLATFNADERLLLSNTFSGDARLWHLDVNDLKSLACEFAGRNMSKEEWQQYLGDRPYQKTCEELPDYVELIPDIAGGGPSATPTPAPQPTPTATPGQACSLNADVSVNVTFVNNSDKTIDVYLVDYDCNEQFYATLAPGDSYVQGAFATHPWVFIDAETGEVLKEFVTGTTDEEVTIP